MVFVHGTRTSAAIWDPQVEALAAAGHGTHAIDLPGHGSRVAERFTLEGALQAIDAAVEAQPVPPLLVGLSLGGYTSLAYAALYQEKLAGVVLSGCSTEIAGKPLRLYRRWSTRIADTFRPGGTWHVVADMLHAMHGYSALADLRRLLVPVWLVNGRRDPLRWGERRMVAAHPLARLHVVDRAGHDVNSHAPTAYTRILLDALAELTPAEVRSLAG
ncbi:alpha/beta fold hydrolase [Isoptericola sp. b441]|uniref:Alpha/beta fold hydrolase n=1 Tax=Actinotalea lenta TaxID=3064654 RepID=A0ABT9D9F4_9CELL|nr:MULTISPECIES: alpha/beta fold hydrolase [unclassified Isoptericola]MDO8107539.1 alpha/beta fold hydrolase [Isoptericola sp. b441]MDO8120801.1 alpha/beta fold hydrolase [Isoptericola sp. b490]